MLQRPQKGLLRVLELVGMVQCDAEIVESVQILRGEGQGLAIALGGAGEHVLSPVGFTKVVQVGGIVRLQGDGLLYPLDGEFVDPALVGDDAV